MVAFKEGRINHNEKENDMPPESPCGNLTFFISWESSQPFCTWENKQYFIPPNNLPKQMVKILLKQISVMLQLQWKKNSLV